MASPFLTPRRIVRFGVFEADLDAGILSRRGARVRIQEKPFRILEALLARPRGIVTREELRERLWAEDTFVDFQHGLDAAMNKLRDAIGDPASSARYIETLPRRGYRFVADTSGQPPRAAETERTMVAVLPFRSASGDPAQEIFTDGLTREMTIRLGRIAPARLGVAPASSSRRYRSGGRRVARIAEDLGVDYVLDGAAHRSDRSIRIDARLVRGDDLSTVWEETFEREVEDEFDLEREVASRVAQALAVELVPSPASSRRAPPRDPVAHELYLRARYYLSQRTPAALRKALAAYEEAVARQPGWAEAHACVAETRVLFVAYGLAAPLDALPHARAEVSRALDLDPTVPDGHTILALIRHRHDWAWDEAERGFERALELDAHCRLVRHLYAELLSHRGRHDEAVAMIREARRTDPLSRLFRSEESCILTNARRYGDAADVARDALDIEESYAFAHHALFRALHGLGRHVEALDVARRGAAGGSPVPYMLGSFGVASAAAGRREEAERVLARLGGGEGPAYVSPVQRARVLLALGRGDDALAALARAAGERAIEIVAIGVDPEWDRLRGDRRFKAILKAVGLA